MTSAIQRKVRRLQAGQQPRVLDLFSGCGGMTLGFVRAGCESIGGVEFDPDAAASHQLNFHPRSPPSIAKAHREAKDITQSCPEDVLRAYGHLYVNDSVDILVGGPPCPTFTRVGRAKLREVHQHPKAFLHDPRARLYAHYLRYVQELQPVALLMENVPDFLNWGGHNLAEEVGDLLETQGYACAYTLLNAASYGVPQLRERFFLMAVHRDAANVLSFPVPTHHVVFPPGYTGTRRVALKALDGVVDHLYVPPPVAAPGMRGATTAAEAIGDLPEIRDHLTGTMRRGARRLDQPVPVLWPANGLSDYARAMRTWPGFASTGWVSDHVIRSLGPRDHRLFEAMSYDDDYPLARALAERLFAEHVAGLRRAGSLPAESSDAFLALHRSFVPPYDPSKFPNKWRKLDPSQPVRTLMAHLGKDTYSHIHYADAQARTISVREAARLQSFPDGFRFQGTMNPAFRQIGNAVPPWLAAHLAFTILNVIGAKVDAAPLSLRAESLRLKPTPVRHTEHPAEVLSARAV